MRYNLSQEGTIERVKTRLNHLYTKGATIEIIEKRKVRTVQQHKYLHLILSWFGLETGYTLEEVKQEIFKRDVCKSFFEYKKGDRILYRSTADLNTKELTEAIEFFRNWSSKQGIYLAAPNEVDFLQEMENQLSMYGNRQYV